MFIQSVRNGPLCQQTAHIPCGSPILYRHRKKKSSDSTANKIDAVRIRCYDLPGSPVPLQIVQGFLPCFSVEQHRGAAMILVCRTNNTSAASRILIQQGIDQCRCHQRLVGKQKHHCTDFGMQCLKPCFQAACLPAAQFGL